MKATNDWHDKFNMISDSIAKARSVLESLAKCTEDSTDLRSALVEIHKELSGITQASTSLKWFFCGGPTEKWLTAQQLTREEFYLLAAQGIIRIPSRDGSVGAHEDYVHYLYEDNQVRGYIVPSQRPGALLEIGIVPEEVRVSFLRTEQVDYFKNFDPKLFSRFRID